MEQLLTNDKDKDVIRKIFLTLTSHEQETQNSIDASVEELSTISMSNINVDDLSAKDDIPTE